MSLTFALPSKVTYPNYIVILEENAHTGTGLNVGSLTPEVARVKNR